MTRQRTPLPAGLSLLLAALLLTRLAGPAHSAPAAAADKVDYNRDVRPILTENCFACHGFDKNARKGDLRLDVREDAIKAKAIVPGKPDESELIARIHSDNPRQVMPTPKSKKTLTAAQKATLRKWISQGAEYQEHWAFLAPRRPELPAVKDAKWVRNPLDRFALAEMEKRGLSPAPEADRRTLARRLALDLTGLPPAPAEVEAFVNDPSPKAYEAYVEKLLTSPHWGEHRGRYWLDASRYADTHGIHFDNYREMWTYRDWVIKAFNRNLPFDRFTIEQLAGDLLPKATLAQRIASGFNRCNITTNEGGAIDEEYLVLYARDRTETVATVWMGLTAGCAVCHNHKFDPLTQKEFYQLAAFFNNTTQRAMDGNIKDTPPILAVPREEDLPRFQAIEKELAEERQNVESRRTVAKAGFEQWLKSAKADEERAKLPVQGLVTHLALNEGKDDIAVSVAGKATTVKAAGAAWEAGHVAEKAFRTKAGVPLELPEVGDFEKDRPFAFGAWVKLPPNAQPGAIFARMDEAQGFRGWDLWVEGGRVGTHLVSKWQEDALKVVTAAPIPSNQWVHVFVSYDGSAKAAGVKIFVNGDEQVNRQVQADALKGSVATRVPFKVGQRSTQSRINNLGVQDVRLYSRAVPAGEVKALARGTRAAWLLSRPADKRTEPEKNELFDTFLAGGDPAYQQAVAKRAALEEEERALRARGTIAHVMAEKPAKAMAHVLFRGEYDKKRDPVEPGTPAVMPAMPPELPRNRLGFAQWLLRPEHPLTARVTVNRFWQEVFGTGLVRTSGDFGISGELPSHPELLDWLAVEFREKNWDVKEFFRLMVTSATYRQAATTTDAKREKDPANVWLSRGPRFRLDAEMIRDYALAASGLLVPKLGGPSVKPYQPEGVWEAVAMIGSNTRDYRADSGENLYRRSLYTFWKRSAPPASLDIFNAPSREVCTVRRDRTNTPLQALVTLNDPQFVEAARVLAQKTLTEGGKTDDERLDYLARRLLARPFRADEAKVARGVLADLLEHYKGKPAEAAKLLKVGEAKVDTSLDPATLAGWVMLTNALLNLDEVLSK